MLKNTTYFENLDGLRFLSFLVVFLFHSFYSTDQKIIDNEWYNAINIFFHNGHLGVNFFFVLSGFLISYFLILEKKETARIHLKNFYLKRVLRIWPLFYFSVFFGFVLFPIIKTYFNQPVNEVANPWYYVFFINNFDIIYHGTPDSSVLGVLWSVAIEEQFYLFWPLILLLVPLKRLPIVFVFIIICSIIYRAYLDSYYARDYSTFSCISDMTVGGLGAWLVIFRSSFLERIQKMNSLTLVFIYVLALSAFFFRDQLLIPNFYIRAVERLFISVLILLIILEQNYCKNSLFKIKNFKLISRLGKYTYALYCLHFIGILIAVKVLEKLSLNDSLWEIIWIETPLALLISLGLAKLSYHFLEQPFLRLKEKLI